jgi:hypothetical protein
LILFLAVQVSLMITSFSVNWGMVVDFLLSFYVQNESS